MSLVVWSGGLDSTLALYDLLVQRNHDVRAITIIHPQVINSYHAHQNRVNIKAKLCSMGLSFNHTEVTVTQKGDFEIDHSDGLIQPQLWIPTAISHLRAHEHLYLGYIKGDDIWHYRTQMYELFNAMQSFRHDDGQLICPLEWIRKDEIIERLKMANLYSLCWYCELSKTLRPCGDCSACLTHKYALQRYEDRMGQKGVKKQLKKIVYDGSEFLRKEESNAGDKTGPAGTKDTGRSTRGVRKNRGQRLARR